MTMTEMEWFDWCYGAGDFLLVLMCVYMADNVYKSSKKYENGMRTIRLGFVVVFIALAIVNASATAFDIHLIELTPWWRLLFHAGRGIATTSLVFLFKYPNIGEGHEPRHATRSNAGCPELDHSTGVRD